MYSSSSKLNLEGISYTKLRISKNVTTISGKSTGTISCIEIEGDSTRFDSNF